MSRQIDLLGLLLLVGLLGEILDLGLRDVLK
jgi:hypothetical protein